MAGDEDFGLRIFEGVMSHKDSFDSFKSKLQNCHFLFLSFFFKHTCDDQQIKSFNFQRDEEKMNLLHAEKYEIEN